VNLDKIRNYLNSKQFVSEELPFGPQALVFKVKGKMYALIAWKEDPLYLSLKCDPDRANSLRASYSSIKPAYHMNKKHWNMIYLDGILNENQLKDMIDHSYDLVVNGLKKTDRIEITGK